jgi:hypothetical protein
VYADDEEGEANEEGGDEDENKEEDDDEEEPTRSLRERRSTDTRRAAGDCDCADAAEDLESSTKFNEDSVKLSEFDDDEESVVVESLS